MASGYARRPDQLTEPPTDLSPLIAAGHRMLLGHGWHLSVCATDLA